MTWEIVLKRIICSCIFSSFLVEYMSQDPEAIDYNPDELV